MNLLKKIFISMEYRKRTTLGGVLYYDTLEIYDNKVVGYVNTQQSMTWYYKDYKGIDVIKASLNSQFAQIVFLTGINSKNKVGGIDLAGSQNANAVNDTNKILFCSGMFSFSKTNDFTNAIATEIRAAYDNCRSYSEVEGVVSPISEADEIKKFKTLLDEGIITQEDFDAKKRKLLGI